METGDRQGAFDAFEAVRALAPGTGLWLEATNFLARLVLADGQDDIVVVLAQQLRGGRGPPVLRLAARPGDRPARCHHRSAGVAGRRRRVVAPGGRRFDIGQVVEVRGMLAAAGGDTDTALDELADAVAGHGRVIGRGALLVAILGDRPPVELADRLRTVGGPHLPQIADEMRAAGGAGPAVAELLAIRP